MEAGTKRKDKNRIRLKKGESQRKNGSYVFRWRDVDGERRSVYAKTLLELREKEQGIQKSMANGIAAWTPAITVNRLYETWIALKRGVKRSTMIDYQCKYDKYIRNSFGRNCIDKIKRSDVKKFYALLIDRDHVQRGVICTIHAILLQLFEMALDDGYIAVNPVSGALKEFKKSLPYSEKRHALTKADQDLLLWFLLRNARYKQWYPIIAVLIGTGMRIGEASALRWCDIEFENNRITVEHTLSYYYKKGQQSSWGITTPKTAASVRRIPMLDFVREAFCMQREWQEETGIQCRMEIDGYTDFVFCTAKGKPLSSSSMDQTINTIVKNCNASGAGILPHFSCHTLRHTFATRMCEMGANIKVTQSILGHSKISTTMDIYTEVTGDFAEETFANLNANFRIQP